MNKETIESLKQANSEVDYAITSGVSLQNKRERLKNLLFASRDDLIKAIDDLAAAREKNNQLMAEIENLNNELAQADEDYKKLKDSMKPKKQKVMDIEQPSEQ